MEHNVEKAIRQKVHEADQLAVTWRKEWVWDHVDLTPEKKPARWFYYAAASILLAGAVVVVLVQQRQQQSTAAKINSLEIKIASVLEEHRRIAVPLAETVCDTSHPIIRQPDQKKAVKRGLEIRTVSDLVMPVSTEVPLTKVDVTLIEPAVQPLETPVVASQVSKPAVQAIIGVIPAQREMVARTSNRKFRMRLFNAFPLEAEYLSLDENRFITAKLK